MLASATMAVTIILMILPSSRVDVYYHHRNGTALFSKGGLYKTIASIA